MYRFIPPLIFLVPQDSNLTHYTLVFGLCCVLNMPLFGLVQARPWFRSSMWVSSVAGFSKVLCASEVASAYSAVKPLAQLVNGNVNVNVNVYVIGHSP